MSDNNKLPNWVLKVLPVLTEHISLSDFEKWIYLPTSEKYFPKELYFELISFDYRKRVIYLQDCIEGFIDADARESLDRIIWFFNEPEYGIDDTYFYALPVSEILLEYVLFKVTYILMGGHWDEEFLNFICPDDVRNLVNTYLNKLVLLLQFYEDKSVIEILRELNKIYK